jgi:hypothetical protein
MFMGIAEDAILDPSGIVIDPAAGAADDPPPDIPGIEDIDEPGPMSMPDIGLESSEEFALPDCPITVPRTITAPLTPAKNGMTAKL